MQTFRIVPVEGQDKFWNVIYNRTDERVCYYDGSDKSFVSLHVGYLTIEEIEELVEQVKEL